MSFQSTIDSNEAYQAKRAGICSMRLEKFEMVSRVSNQLLQHLYGLESVSAEEDELDTGDDEVWIAFGGLIRLNIRIRVRPTTVNVGITVPGRLVLIR